MVVFMRFLIFCISDVLLLVMEAALSNGDLISFWDVEEAVFAGDSSRPVAAVVGFEWLWFSNPLKGISEGVSDDKIDSLNHSFVGFLPVKVVVPSIDEPNELHGSTSSPSTVFPSLKSTSDFSRRARLAGVEIK